MNWMKENYGKSILLAVSLLLGASSAILIMNAMGFQEVFAQIQSTMAQGNKMPALPVEPVLAARQALDQPAKWDLRSQSLFVSKPYLVKDDQLFNPLKPGSQPLYPPVSNEWIMEHDLDILDPSIVSADTDGDKFTNLQEYEARTNPQDKNSTPPRYLLLRLKELRQVPNRIMFTSYTDDTVTINTQDIRQPSQFLATGEQIKGTKFKVLKLEKKTIQKDLGGGTMVDRDVSEVTLEHMDTGEKRILIKEVLTDLGEGFVVLKYLLDGSEIKLKRNQEFKLKPDETVTYRYTGNKDGNAVIVEAPTGKEILVPREEQTAAPADGPSFSGASPP